MESVNPVTVWPEPRQVCKDGAWEVQVIGDIDDLPIERMVALCKEAGSSFSVTWTHQGDLKTAIFRYDTRTAAEGAIRRLKAVLG